VIISPATLATLVGHLRGEEKNLSKNLEVMSQSPFRDAGGFSEWEFVAGETSWGDDPKCRLLRCLAREVAISIGEINSDFGWWVFFL
jgi:hypothetical protein